MKNAWLWSVFLVAGSANAALIEFGPTSSNAMGPEITYTDVVTPTSITGDATVSLSVEGDLDWSSEYIDITFDSFSLGRIFDNDSSNDLFDFSGDEGNQHGSVLSGTATISEADFAALIADGDLDLTFAANPFVDLVKSGFSLKLSGSISFDDSSSSSSTAVPEPGSLALLGLGLAGIGISRKKAKA